MRTEDEIHALLIQTCRDFALVRQDHLSDVFHLLAVILAFYETRGSKEKVLSSPLLQRMVARIRERTGH